MARRVEHGPPAAVDQPPCAGGVAAVDAWAQRARMAVGDGPRAEAVGRCLDLLAGTSRAAQDSEAVLRLQGAAEHGGCAGEAAAEGALAAAASGGEAPIDPVALALWQWCEAARQCHLAAVGPSYVVEAACAEVRRLCRAVRARPLAAYEEAKRRFRSSDLRAAVAEKAEADARLAEESLDDGRVAAARESLVGYGHWMLRSFQSPRHIQIIARALERIESGECRRLIIEVSPRHGKSATTSVLFASWYMGRHPDRDIIAASSSQGLANTFGMQVRDLVTRDEFRRVFPHVYPDGEGMSFFRMETDEEWVGLDGQRGGVRARKGTYQVLGRKTKASGKGANLLLIDDLIDEKEADSDAAMAEARRCVQALRSRLAPDNEGSAIVVINTRYREDDVIGFVESEMAADGPWERVRLPSWTDEPADYDLPDGTVWHRQAGEPLWPERYTAEELLRVRDYLLRTSPRDWWAQHCCLIVPSSGAVVDLGWFQRYSGQLAALRHRAARAVVSVDTSKGASSSAARTSITVWLEVAGPVGPGEDGGAYLVWAWAEPVLAPAQIAKMKEVCARWRPHLMLVEGKSTADAVIPILRADPDWARTPIVEVLPDRDKVQRMNLASPQVRDRQVWLPAKGVDWAPWLPEVEKELTFFPKGRFKDLVDSVSQYLNWRRENPLHGSDRSSEVGAALRQRFGGQWGRGGSGWGRPP